MLGWSEMIYNHITLKIPGEDGAFLINPFGLHFSEVTASSLAKIDIDETSSLAASAGISSVPTLMGVSRSTSW